MIFAWSRVCAGPSFRLRCSRFWRQCLFHHFSGKNPFPEVLVFAFPGVSHPGLFATRIFAAHRTDCRLRFREVTPATSRRRSRASGAARAPGLELASGRLPQAYLLRIGAWVHLGALLPFFLVPTFMFSKPVPLLRGVPSKSDECL